MAIRSQVRLSILAVLCLCASLTQAGDTVRLITDSETRIDKAGIRIRPFRDFASRPMRLPEIVTLRNPRTGEELEAYDVDALWRYDQTYAVYEHDVGRVTVAVIDYPLPAADLPLMAGRHIRLDDFNQAMAATTTPTKLEDIRAWVETYTGKPIAEESDRVKGVTVRYPFRQYTFKGVAADQMQAWCLLVDRRRDARTYVMVLYEFAQPDTIRDLDRAIGTSIESVRWIGREARQASVAAATAIPPVGENAVDARAANYAATKSRIIRNIENLDNWWYLELPHYIVATDLDKGRDRLVRMIEEDMEIIRGAYARLIPAEVKIDEISVIRVFATREDYGHYVPDGFDWTGGIWMPMKKELVISPIDIGNDRKSRGLTLSVVYHEGFHQYLFYALGKRDPPVWFNEGHAAFFEGADVSVGQKRVHIEEVEHRVEAYLKVAGSVDLERLMRLNRASFYEPDTVSANYATAYALIYFLRKAGDRYKGKDYEKLCDLVISSMMENGDPRAATETILKAYDMAELERDMREFWENKTERRRAENRTLFR